MFYATDGFSGPFFKGNGSIDLLCGKCSYVLEQGLNQDHVSSLVTSGRKCKSYNSILSMSALTAFVSEVQAIPDSFDQISALKVILQEASHYEATHSDVIARIEKLTPGLAHVKDLLTPQTSADFYALVGCLLVFLSWLQGRKQSKQPPSVVIKNFLDDRDPYQKSENQ